MELTRRLLERTLDYEETYPEPPDTDSVSRTCFLFKGNLTKSDLTLDRCR